MEVELPAEGYAGAFPELAGGYDDGEVKVKFRASTRGWYRVWATSPMAAQFTSVEWSRLGRLAVLVDIYARRPLTRGLAGEIRLQEASLGGSPLDRRRMGVKIAAREPVQDAQVTALADYRRELGS